MFARVINQVKGFAILLVVLGHIKSPYGDLIYSFHMPLFFFIGGIFINKEQLLIVFFKKNFYRLIVPYLIFSTVGIIVNNLKNLALHRDQESFINIIEGVFLWADPSHMHHYGFVLWFLPALFWGRIIFCILLKISPFSSLLNFLLLIVTSWIGGYLYMLPLGIDEGLVVTPWIALGYFYYQYTDGKFFAPTAVALFLFIILVLFVNIWGMPSVDLGLKQTDNKLITIPYTLIVIILLIYIFTIINLLNMLYITRFFDYLGGFTLFIMILHVYTNNITSILLNNILSIENWSLIFISSMGLIFFILRLKKLILFN